MTYIGNYTRGLGNTGNPQQHMGNSTLERGFQLLKKRKHLETLWLGIRNIWSRIICSPFPPAEDKEYAYFVHRKTAVTNQNIFGILKYVFRKSEYCSTELFTFSEIDSVSRIHKTLVKEPSLHHEKEHHKVIRWILLLNFLYGWDFPSSHKVHTDQGKTLFEAVMCTVGAASQISCMLTEDICFWYKMSLESPQDFNKLTRHTQTSISQG